MLRRSVLRAALAAATIGLLAFAPGCGSDHHRGGRGQRPNRRPSVRAVTYREAATIPLHQPLSAVLARFGRPLTSVVRHYRHFGPRYCIFYPASGLPREQWQFCFHNGSLESVASLVH
jgi:hypothetical protein